MNRFKFGGQKLSKCPDMIRQSGGHARSAVAPLELNQARGVWLLLRQRQAQAHVRPGKIVEGLKEDHTPSHLSAILTETPALAHQRRQSMAQSEVETFNQTGADRVAQRFEPLAPAAHAVAQLLETSLVFLFDHLAIDQIRVGFLERLLGASWLARAWKGLQGMVDVNQSRQITAEAITEKARHAQDHGGRHLHEPQGTGKRPWANKRRQDESELGSKTDPHPLPSVLTPLGAFAIRTGRLGMFTSDEAPHLIELHLSDRQVPQQVGIDLMGFLCGSPQPLQNGFFRHAQDKTDVREGHFDQQHREGSCDSAVGLSGTFLQQRLYYPKVGSVDTLLEYLTGCGADVHLTLLFVHIDATLFPR